MPKITQTPVTIFLTPKCKITDSTVKIGEIQAGFNMKGFDLAGKTGTRNRSYCTEGLNACTCGIFLGKLMNMFHENSSIYADAEGSKNKIFDAISKKVTNMANNTKDKVQAFLFGGWGYENVHNSNEIEKSHNLFNNIALCIEDVLPEKEKLEIPLTTIWGKINSSTPDLVYCRDNTIVLENDIFKSLFKRKNSILNKENLIKFLQEHYEEVQIPDNIELIAKEQYIPSSSIINTLKQRKNINLTV